MINIESNFLFLCLSNVSASLSKVHESIEELQNWQDSSSTEGILLNATETEFFLAKHLSKRQIAEMDLLRPRFGACALAFHSHAVRLL